MVTYFIGVSKLGFAIARNFIHTIQPIIKMTKISREDIYIVSQNSNWSEEGVEDALKNHVLSNKSAWITFLRLFFISLGVAFTVSGVIFFFAYNWDDLSKFVKFGLVEGLLVFITIIAVLPQIKPNIRNIILTGASMLVGVLFAVFGQVYQTGANAYDFFLAWTLFVTIWVLVANFPALWLVFLVLIHTTFLLFTAQANQEWSSMLIALVVFLFNAIALALFTTLSPKGNKLSLDAPSWLLQLIALTAIGCATMGICVGIVDKFDIEGFVLLGLTFVLYALGIYYGLTKQKLFYLAIIPVSILIIVFTFVLDLFKSHNALIYFVLSLMVIGSISALAFSLSNLKKQWDNDEPA
jgi:uncharacterized membrane protein